MTELIKYIEHQNDNRTLWVDHDSPEKLAEMIQAEAKELIDALQESFVTGDVFSVASEIGDIRYVLDRLSLMLGIDSSQAAEMKVVRNSLKYPDHVMSNGRNFESASQVSKDAWKAMGGDYMFSHIYLDYLAHI